MSMYAEAVSAPVTLEMEREGQSIKELLVAQPQLYATEYWAFPCTKVSLREVVEVADGKTSTSFTYRNKCCGACPIGCGTSNCEFDSSGKTVTVQGPVTSKGTLTDFDGKVATYSIEAKHPVYGYTMKSSFVIDFAAKTKTLNLPKGSTIRTVVLHGE